jgi:hypothetical protein
MVGYRLPAAALLVVGIAAAPVRSPAGDDHRAEQRAVGLVVEVERSRLVLETLGSGTLELRTSQDYRDQVTVGSRLTVWYDRTPRGNVLVKLEAPEGSATGPAIPLRQRIRKIIILPNSSLEGADGLYAGVSQYLQAQLGWYVAPAALAAEVRRQTEQPASTLEAFDTTTGQFDMARYIHGPSLIPRLASETRTDAVLEVDVEPVEARVDHMVAAWDHWQEALGGSGIRTLSRLTPFAGKGTLPATTVELRLFDRDGRLLWSNRLGLALLVVPAGGLTNKLRERPLSESLADPVRFRRWLSAAFASLTGAPAIPRASTDR